MFLGLGALMLLAFWSVFCYRHGRFNGYVTAERDLARKELNEIKQRSR